MQRGTNITLVSLFVHMEQPITRHLNERVPEGASLFNSQNRLFPLIRFQRHTYLPGCALSVSFTLNWRLHLRTKEPARSTLQCTFAPTHPALRSH